MSPERKRLKLFLEKNIPFYELKKEGFFGKDIRKTDYEKIAARVCHYFGFKSIYEYKRVCRGKHCDGDCDRSSDYCPHKKSPLHWDELEVDEEEIISEEKYLN